MVAAAALVAGNMIGTGIFTSLGFQVLDIKTGFGIVLIWVVGGVMAFCGALCYAELGASMPRSGGEYHLLGTVWHPLAGFLAGWLSMTVAFAAPVALAASAFGTYLANSIFDGDPMARFACALAVLLAVTFVHLINVRVSGRFQIAATLLKITLLIVLIAAGLAVSPAQPLSFTPAPADDGLLLRGEFIVALFFVSYSYCGWNAAIYVVGDMRNPQRDLPLALLLGTGFVTLLYVLVNVAFLRAAPISDLSGAPDAGLVAARHLFGERSGSLMGVFIAAGLVSTISAMMWAGPRVAKTIGEDWAVFSPLAAVTRHGVPALATLLQTAIALGLLTFGGFADVLTYIEFTLALSTFLTVAGVFWLRWKRPSLPRPFEAWGYPITPAVYLLFTGYVLVRFATDPEQWVKSLLGFATIAAGAVIYVLSPKKLINGG